MVKTVRLQIKDGLGLPSGFISPATYDCVLYYTVPEDWLSDGKVTPEKQEAMLENMYGKTWRQGNSDGSYYAVLALDAKILSDEEMQNRIWLSEDPNDRNFKYWFYQVSETGEFKGVKREEF
ncbi:MAG: hypothetical protein AB1757_14185 [Acidobacteriota bacterium]